MIDNFESQMRLDLIDINKVRDFKGRDVLRVTDFNKDEILYILEIGRVIANNIRKYKYDLSKCDITKLGEGFRGATVFYEPSTRTHDSSVVAMTNLGMKVPIIRRSTAGTSQKKSESLSHDLFMYATYGIHAIVMRHPNEGAPQWAADYLEKMSKIHNKVRPVIINGGDGAHCHPTQALLDALAYYMLYFVDEQGKDIEAGKLNSRNVFSGITLYGIGDSLKGRTIKDNAKLLAKFEDNELVLVGPSEIRLPLEDIRELERSGLKVTILEDIPSAIEHAKTKRRPIFYFMRVQEERLEPRIVESVRGKVTVDKETLLPTGIVVNNTENGSTYKKTIPFFHPLPMHKKHREISPELEETANFKCFYESEMGPYIRMSIIGLVTGIIKTKIQNKYSDTREDVSQKTYQELPLPTKHNGKLFKGLKKLVDSDEGSILFRNFIGLIKQGANPKDVFNEFLDEASKEKEILEYRHITFRFMKGEDGTVIDHVKNGLTGLIKFQLGLSELIGKTGSDRKPIVVSAVDGIDSSKYGMKGVIKIRGHLVNPEKLHYCYLLSDTDMSLSHIRDGKVIAKYTPMLPNVIKNFIKCKNPLCISRRKYNEYSPTIFYLGKGETYKCRYCDTLVNRSEIRGLLIRGD